MLFILKIPEINAHSLTVNVSFLQFVSKLSERTLLFSLFLALRPLNASIFTFVGHNLRFLVRDKSLISRLESVF